MAVMAIGHCVACTVAYAQNVAGNITGKITDSIHQPLSAATVVLRKGNKPDGIKYALSAADGSFSMPCAQTGTYTVHVTAVGFGIYESASFVIDSLHPQVTLPVCIMKQTTTVLQQVTVTASKPFVEQKVDRTVVNVDALINSAGVTALDVLETAPGVRVDANGSISLKGVQGVAVYIDDRPCYLSGQQLQSYLQSLPATVLSQIEIMSNPPARYDAAGNGGIINIKTVKQKMKGYNVGLSSGIRYAKYVATNNNMDFNYRSNRFNLFGTFSYGSRNSYNDIDIYRRYLDDKGSATGTFQQNSYMRRMGSGYRSTLGVDYFLSQLTTLGVVVSRLARYPKSSNTSWGSVYDEYEQPDSSLRSQNVEAGSFKNNRVNLSIKHDFAKNGPLLQTNFDYLEYSTGNNQVLTTGNYSAAGVLQSAEQLVGDLPSNIKIYSAKADYEQTLANKWKLEAGAKISYTNTSNIANYYNVVAGIAEPDYDKTNHFQYKENMNAAYINLNKTLHQLTVQLGLRYEGTLSKGHQLGNAIKPDSSFHRRYHNVFPTLFLLYKLDTLGRHQLKFNYGRRIGRPYYQDLNPFISPLDKLTFYVGNPYLKPSFSSKYELGYIFNNQVTATVNYTDTKDLVNETITINDQKYYSRPGNIGKATSLSIGVDASIRPQPWLNLQLSAQMNFAYFKSDFYTGSLEVKNQYVYTQVLVQWKLKKSWAMQLDGNYTSRSKNAQFVLANRGKVNYAVSKVVSPAVTVKANVTDIFSTGVNKGQITNLAATYATFQTLSDTRSFLLTVSIRVGKRVEGQRKQIESGAETEQNRVKD
ncbi:TonB-dependent receptor [Filimonas lacunae]|nr:TonB-dependent receptor [Filimonas lacunae]